MSQYVRVFASNIISGDSKPLCLLDLREVRGVVEGIIGYVTANLHSSESLQQQNDELRQ